MIYITGDTHGEFSRIEQFCERIKPTRDDTMIILGDAGINYYGGWRDIHKKQRLAKLPITLFAIHGNHEGVASRAHLVHHAAGRGLRSQLHLRCHGCRYRSPDNIALHQPQPFPLRVQRMLQLQLVLTVQGFRDGTGGRRYHAYAVG